MTVCACLSVCPLAYLVNRIAILCQIFCACWLWLWFGPSVAALRYLMYFRFCGWRYFIVSYNSPYGGVPLLQQHRCIVVIWITPLLRYTVTSGPILDGGRLDEFIVPARGDGAEYTMHHCLVIVATLSCYRSQNSAVAHDSWQRWWWNSHYVCDSAATIKCCQRRQAVWCCKTPWCDEKARIPRVSFGACCIHRFSKSIRHCDTYKANC